MMRLSSSIFRTIARATALSVAACSGESNDSSPISEDELGSGVTGASEEAAGPDASIRFVNFWVHEGAGAPVDVYVRSGFGRERPLFQNVGFGEVVAGAVPGDATVTMYRASQPGAGEGLGSPTFIVYEDLEHDIETGVPLTVVLTYFPSLGEGELAGAIDVFYDAGDYVSGDMRAEPVEGVLLVASISPIGRVLGDGNEGFKFGIPAAGCLRPAGVPSGGSIAVSAGGTSTLTYDVEPGASEIAGYPLSDRECAGTPGIGPVDVEAAHGRRMYLFAYGTGSDDLRLLSLPSDGE